MVLQKQKWYLIISLLLIINVSCDKKKNTLKSNNQLECLLDVFIDKPPTNEEDYIYISEGQNWTDTTSVISFQYSNIPPSDSLDSIKVEITTYKKFKIVHSSSSFNKLVNIKHSVPNNFDWKKINPKDFKSISEDEYLNYSEYEMQIIYDFKNQKITNVLKAYPLDESAVLEKIKRCAL